MTYYLLNVTKTEAIASTALKLIIQKLSHQGMAMKLEETHFIGFEIRLSVSLLG